MKMKTKLYLLLGLFAACLLISCNDDEDPIDEAYKLANEAQFAKITADPPTPRSHRSLQTVISCTRSWLTGIRRETYFPTR